MCELLIILSFISAYDTHSSYWHESQQWRAAEEFLKLLFSVQIDLLLIMHTSLSLGYGAYLLHLAVFQALLFHVFWLWVSSHSHGTWVDRSSGILFRFLGVSMANVPAGQLFHLGWNPTRNSLDARFTPTSIQSTPMCKYRFHFSSSFAKFNSVQIGRK